ncbi:hypothetical protein JTM25_006965 [Pseudomonas aeruginosa]|nr:hypothetical protein [Pseudomonas aeruginosa]
MQFDAQRATGRREGFGVERQAEGHEFASGQHRLAGQQPLWTVALVDHQQCHLHLAAAWQVALDAAQRSAQLAQVGR